MHKYNNQDHAMMTAMLTSENILAELRGNDGSVQKSAPYDVWRVNEDAEYHEAGSAGSASGLRIVPSRI
jgi:hypothetical protein